MRPIKLTEAEVRELISEFTKELSSNMFDGKISFSRTFKTELDGDEKAKVVFSPNAYAKMVALIQQFDSEVAWHGTVTRVDDTTFLIEDILVYPQEVSGSTVNTDQVPYQEWLYSLDDDTFNSLRMQGHSHVRMGTTPSGVDTNHQESIISQLEDNDFYIFMIWNKSFDRTIKIFDLQNNLLYENKDVKVFIGENDIDGFIEAAKEVVVDKKKKEEKKEEKTRIGSGWHGRGFSYLFDGAYD